MRIKKKKSVLFVYAILFIMVMSCGLWVAVYCFT